MIAAKKSCLTQWQVVICRDNVDGVRGNLAKSQAVIRRAKLGFKEKSEGEVVLPKVQIDYHSRIVKRVCSILDTSVGGNTVQERWLPWKMRSPQRIQR